MCSEVVLFFSVLRSGVVLSVFRNGVAVQCVQKWCCSSVCSEVVLFFSVFRSGVALQCVLKWCCSSVC